MGSFGETYRKDKASEYDNDPFYEEDDDISNVPLVKQPAYGSRLWQRPINFVTAAPPTPEKVPTPPKAKGPNYADLYFSIVYPNGIPPLKPKPQTHPICDECKTPITEATDKEHFMSFAHQQSLPRVPMPSNIDRTRMGLKYLEKYGFDVDARVGLGAEAQGISFPIKPEEKRDRLGIGMDKMKVEKKKNQEQAPKPVCIDAKMRRKKYAEDKKKHERLARLFFADDDDKERVLLGLPKVDHGLKK